jgi:hypothetical protein
MYRGKVQGWKKCFDRGVLPYFQIDLIMNFIPNESPSKTGFMSIISMPINKPWLSELLMCVGLYAKMTSYSTICTIRVHISIKNNRRFVISIENWSWGHLASLLLMENNFSEKCIFSTFRFKYVSTRFFRKIIFRQK